MNILRYVSDFFALFFGLIFERFHRFLQSSHRGLHIHHYLQHIAVIARGDRRGCIWKFGRYRCLPEIFRVRHSLPPTATLPIPKFEDWPGQNNS
jgi:hypothetical protein